MSLAQQLVPVHRSSTQQQQQLIPMGPKGVGISFIDPNWMFEGLPNHFSKIKLDEDYPLDPKKNSIYYRYLPYDRKKGGKGKAYKLYAFWYKEHAPVTDKPIYGRYPCKELMPVVMPTSVRIFPAGNLFDAVPGETNASFYKKEEDEVTCQLDLDGYAPFAELVDPTDPRKRDIHWNEYTEYGYKRDRHVAATVLDSPQIQNQFKSDALTFFGGLEKIKVPGSKERKDAIEYLLNKGNPFAPLKAKKARKAQFHNYGRYAETSLDLSDHPDSVTITATPETTTTTTKKRKNKTDQKVPEDRMEDSERIWCGRKMFVKVDDENKKTAEELAGKMVLHRADKTTELVTNPILHSVVKRSNFMVRDIPVSRATIGADGRLVIEPIRNKHERPFWTCKLVEDPETKKLIIRPMDEETLQNYRNTLVVPLVSIEYYLASVQGKSQGVEHELEGLILVDRQPSNPRPGFGVHTLIQLPPENEQNEKCKLAVEAMRRDIEDRKLSQQQQQQPPAPTQKLEEKKIPSVTVADEKKGSDTSSSSPSGEGGFMGSTIVVMPAPPATPVEPPGKEKEKERKSKKRDRSPEKEVVAEPEKKKNKKSNSSSSSSSKKHHHKEMLSEKSMNINDDD
jgi:hypothetical protein